MLGQTEEMTFPLESNLLSTPSHEEHGQHSTPLLPPHQTVQQGSSHKRFLFSYFTEH